MTFQIITKAHLVAEARKRRKLSESEEIPRATFAEGFDIKSHLRIVKDGKRPVAEFIGTDAFATAFYNRQRYEVDAGRDQEPILYLPVFSPVVDSTLPRTININTLGPAGVVLEEIYEGGEVQFATVGQGSKTVTMRHFAVGLSYTEEIFIYNELWRLPNIERQFGVAHNALLNHLHLNPILGATYAADNQTDGTALTTFKVAASMPEKYLRAIEAAITHAIADATNPRRGPFALLVATGDVFTVERALNRVPQQGFDLQSSAIGRIQSVIAYDGWSGARGKKATSYAGATVGTGYLVDLGNRMMDFQSYVKQPFRRQSQPGDMKKFVVEEVIWDTRLGVYANPTAAVEEITWPLAASGEA